MNLVRLVNEWYSDLVTAKELLDLEKQVLSTLQFDIQIETSLNFVDRFLTLYSLDCKSARTFDQ